MKIYQFEIYAQVKARDLRTAEKKLKLRDTKHVMFSEPKNRGMFKGFFTIRRNA